ncbi:MAG: hypothetical protein H6823_24400 [Planctomycetaceae bacterium]|nr:hypothetical protein [Planctomycetaceae bacterium]
MMLRRIRQLRKAAARKARKPGRSSNRLSGFEPLEERIALSATPFGAQPDDTAEFLLGTVNVSVVLLESNKVQSNDNPTVGTSREENWTSASINSVKQKVTEGLQWWVDTLEGITDKHQLSFNIDFTHADTPVSTRFEPITQPASDYQFWIYDFLNSEVNTTGSFTTDVRAYNHNQRVANNTNWAFTIFVVNDENDADHKFDVTSGGLERAFAFPGGLFLVTLASRPASTIAHETGHIFWAMDEYQGGGTYNSSRGYYDTQNVNAWNNPTPGVIREPSIMDRGSCEEGGGLLCTAYQQHTSSASSLAMLGWRDSDGDGIFDVLDVEHSLEGTGSYDPSTGTYRFVGESSVQTLPNLNPRESSLPTESLRNDITINRISRAEYRIDGGAWQTAASPNAYVATLDLRFAVPSTASKVEIRTIDAVSGVTSPVFVGDLTRPASTQQTGIRGFVFTDSDQDGVIDTGEGGLAGSTVRLVNASGQPISLQNRIEPDDHNPNAVISNVNAAATLTAVGSATSGDKVYARSVGQSSTGSQAFSACSFTASGGACSIYQTEWTSSTRQLRIDFTSPVTTLSIDAVSNNPVDYGRLEIYDANDNLLARYTTDAIASGQFETMTLSRPTADIAYALAGGHADTGVRLDNLRFGPVASAVTDAFGAYSIPNLEPGTYQVQVIGPSGSQATSPTTKSVSLTTNELMATADFGFAAFASRWQNQTNRFDVNNDGAVSPLDALQIINDLNSKGSRILVIADGVPPYLDVNGDGSVAPIDVLQVINAIEAAASEGESPLLGDSSPITVVAAAPPMAEGEFVQTIAAAVEVNPASLASPLNANVQHTVESSPRVQLPPQATAEVAKSQRLSHVATKPASDDLLTTDAIEDAIEAFAEDLAAFWGLSQDSA